MFSNKCTSIIIMYICAYVLYVFCTSIIINKNYHYGYYYKVFYFMFWKYCALMEKFCVCVCMWSTNCLDSPPYIQYSHLFIYTVLVLDCNLFQGKKNVYFVLHFSVFLPNSIYILLAVKEIFYKYNSFFFLNSLLETSLVL